MNRTRLIVLCLVCLLLTGCAQTAEDPVVETAPIPVTLPRVLPTEPPPPPTTTAPELVYEFTDEEKEMLLKIGMAEKGQSGCTDCIALVMRTILNRVESGRFGSSIRSVLFAQGQFTPIADGTYAKAEPTLRCEDALDMVAQGWDESQGALFYEWCEGESWHSQNLELLFQHCDTRFYK